MRTITNKAELFQLWDDHVNKKIKINKIKSIPLGISNESKFVTMIPPVNKNDPFIIHYLPDTVTRNDARPISVMIPQNFMKPNGDIIHIHFMVSIMGGKKSKSVKSKRRNSKSKRRNNKSKRMNCMTYFM